MSGDEPLWWLYLLDCDGRLYTGISTDPQRRYQEHLSGGAKGARFTRAASNLTMVWLMQIGDRSLALRAEYRLRRLRRGQKLEVISRVADLATLLDLLNLNDRQDRRL
ncbi:GIY-YIG nuclease family protein [Alcanivorax sp. 1008]|uniref:GIY-YIG nuclease family protein n=1 Tax=Alcanivorax sp. 1008 TaxID=2816853 RepID=UPI001DBE91B5|nr:GIY-YIG nuclease family protein [Alcanivorax sp. 1008]MCC1495958.1 GIY-YIG nuclease family protein [Alcanivorax sp. 1008]